MPPIPRQHFGKKTGEEGDEKREENDKRHKTDEDGDGKDTFLTRGDIRGHKALGKRTLREDAAKEIREFKRH